MKIHFFTASSFVSFFVFMELLFHRSLYVLLNFDVYKGLWSHGYSKVG